MPTLSGNVSPAGEIELRALPIEIRWAIGIIIVFVKIERAVHALFNQDVVQGTVHDDVVLDDNASGFPRRRTDIKVDADPAVETRVVFDFVADEIRRDASALRVVVDQI